MKRISEARLSPVAMAIFTIPCLRFSTPERPCLPKGPPTFLKVAGHRRTQLLMRLSVTSHLRLVTVW